MRALQKYKLFSGYKTIFYYIYASSYNTQTKRIVIERRGGKVSKKIYY
ncbi:MAG: hypothetical protein J6V62_01415 [Paludibacteraceae bacterium]|nr:hypothetical protein [Paludibacteraceae bacterium]